VEIEMHSLRKLLASDEGRILSLNAESQPAVARLDPRELARLLSLSPEHLAIDAGEAGVIGYALVFASDADYDGEEFSALRHRLAEPFLYIDQVVIEKGARGGGLGRALYDQLAGLAERRGMRYLACEVNTQPANPASLAFHLRLGFLPLGPMATADGREVVLLVRQLGPKLSR
jgi:predicted GNAT superfamily acetyltransferase